MSHMMVTKNPQNVHRKCFWTILLTFIFDVKIDVKMCEPHYVNLFFLWTSSIVYVFDFLTFDIFLTTWHLFDNLTSFWHMSNVAHGQWGTWAMGHMGHNFLNTAWILTKILLHIDIDGFSWNIVWFFHDGLILVLFFMFLWPLPFPNYMNLHFFGYSRTICKWAGILIWRHTAMHYGVLVTKNSIKSEEEDNMAEIAIFHNFRAS